MPVKLGSKLPPESAEARIEIVPLIDIMFFLLASFMLVSLSMVKLKNVKVHLPAASTASSESAAKDLFSISVDKSGATHLEGKPVAENELTRRLADAKKGNPQLRVVISGDRDARHGAVIHVLDLVRAAGVEKVAFETRHPEPAAGGTSGRGGAKP